MTATTCPASARGTADPKRKPVASMVTSEKARTRKLAAPLAKPGADCSSGAGASAASPLHPNEAKKIPKIPPTIEISKLSVSSWRTMRPEPAPTAFRIANSLARIAPRASRRFARFAHAISKTKITAPINTRSAGRVSPASMSRKLANSARHPFRPGCSCCRRSES